jgi:hypothetical protein
MQSGVCCARRGLSAPAAELVGEHQPEFAAKAADIVRLYLNPPEPALVISVDEKPSLPAWERATGYVRPTMAKSFAGSRGLQASRDIESVCALEVGAIHTQITRHKRQTGVSGLHGSADGREAAGQDIHVTLDNACIHKRNDTWLAV